MEIGGDNLNSAISDSFFQALIDEYKDVAELEYEQMEEFYLNSEICSELFLSILTLTFFLPYFIISPCIYFGALKNRVHDSIYSRKLFISKDAITFEFNGLSRTVCTRKILAEKDLEILKHERTKSIFFKDIRRVDFIGAYDSSISTEGGGICDCCFPLKRFDSVSVLTIDDKKFMIHGLKHGREFKRFVDIILNKMNSSSIESFDVGFFTSLPSASDTYFRSDYDNMDDIIAVFDFDYEKMKEYYSTKECVSQNFQTLFALVGCACFLFNPCVWCICGKDNVRDYVYTQHLAATAEYIVYVHEKRKVCCRFDCCCFETRRVTKIYFEEVWEASVKEELACWDCCGILTCFPQLATRSNFVSINNGGDNYNDDNDSFDRHPDRLSVLGLKYPREFREFVLKMKEIDGPTRRLLFPNTTTKIKSINIVPPEDVFTIIHGNE